MLLKEGTLEGAQILKPETVMRMRTERAGHGREFVKGCEWGLGMLNFQSVEQTGRYVGEGTFGWSGAYGTHFYVDPQNKMTVVMMTQRTDLGGAGNPIAIGLEKVLYQEFVGGEVKEEQR